MAVFVLRTLDPALNPPACAPPNLFADVPETSPFCRWIEELANRGVVTGCGGGNYCPTASVTREQMSVFLAVTFGLTPVRGVALSVPVIPWRRRVPGRRHEIFRLTGRLQRGVTFPRPTSSEPYHRTRCLRCRGEPAVFQRAGAVVPGLGSRSRFACEAPLPRAPVTDDRSGGKRGSRSPCVFRRRLGLERGGPQNPGVALMTRTRRALLAALAASSLTAANLEAVVPHKSPLAEKSFRHANIRIPSEYLSLQQVPAQSRERVGADIASLGIGSDSALYSARAGRLASLIVSEPLVPGTGVGNTLQWVELRRPAGRRGRDEGRGLERGHRLPPAARRGPPRRRLRAFGAAHRHLRGRQHHPGLLAAHAERDPRA